jgi:hypothetical protein
LLPTTSLFTSSATLRGMHGLSQNSTRRIKDFSVLEQSYVLVAASPSLSIVLGVLAKCEQNVRVHRNEVRELISRFLEFGDELEYRP